MKLSGLLKFLMLICCLKICANGTFAQNSIPVLEFAHTTGGNFNDYPTQMAFDASGNIYRLGYYQDSVDVDPDTAEVIIVAQGGYDFFVQKLDRKGNHLWVKSIGARNTSEQAWDIKVSPGGMIYIVGEFGSRTDFDPGPGVANLNTRGRDDIFVLKLDTSGTFQWARGFGGSLDETGRSIAIDAQENCYFTGYFESSSVDFDPSGATYNVSSNGDEEIFVAKIDSRGNFQWAHSFGSSSFDQGRGIEVDINGDVIVGGYFTGTVDFDPDTSVSVSRRSRGNSDYFILKLDDLGNHLWSASFGARSLEFCYDIATDSRGNIYTTGNFRYTVDFDPGSGVDNISVAGTGGNGDVFIHKLDSSGNHVWAKNLGGSSTEVGTSLSVSKSGNVYTTGYFSRDGDYDPGSGTYTLTNRGNYDVFVHALDSTGNFKWAGSIGSSPNELGWAAAVDPFGAIYFAGNFEGSIDLDPGPRVSTGTAVDRVEMYHIKILDCLQDTTIDTLIACDSLQWINGVTYTSSNDSAIYVISGANGCDSVIRLQLTIAHPSFGVDSITACDSYIWRDGITYTSSNNSANDTILNALGCDSIISLDLRLNSSSSGIDSVSACDSYIWINGGAYRSSISGIQHTITNVAGCDSLVSLELEIRNSTSAIDSQLACKWFRWIDGQDYFNSNNSASFTLTNTAGCDSVVNLALTIQQVDVDVAQTNERLTAFEPAGTYQLLNCPSYSPVPGAQSQVFFAPSNGEYAVAVTKDNCTDTSDCVSVTTVGVKEQTLIHNPEIFPNPSRGYLNIDLGTFQRTLGLAILDLEGRIVFQADYDNESQIEIRPELPSGIYTIRIQYAEGKTSQHKLLIAD